MSAGQYTISRYQATYNPAQVHPIRIQPETLALSITIGATPTVNAVPAAAAAITNPISAVVSNGKRTRGLTPRKITLQFTGTPPTGYTTGGVTTVPVMNPALLAAGAGSVGTYLGAAVRVVGVAPEVVR